MAHPAARLRGWRLRADVDVAGGNRALGTGPRRRRSHREPARDRVRSQRTPNGGMPSVPAGPCSATARAGPRNRFRRRPRARASPRSPSPGRRRSSPTGSCSTPRAARATSEGCSSTTATAGRWTPKRRRRSDRHRKCRRWWPAYPTAGPPSWPNPTGPAKAERSCSLVRRPASRGSRRPRRCPTAARRLRWPCFAKTARYGSWPRAAPPTASASKASPRRRPECPRR